MAKQKSGKRADKRPARARYWTRRRLRENKVRNILLDAARGGKEVTRAEALAIWLKARTKRAKEI